MILLHTLLTILFLFRKRDKAKVKKFVKPDHKINLDAVKLRLNKV